VTVVIAERGEEPAGMTLNAFSSVSLDPLLVLVSLGRGSRTLAAVRAARRLSISLLAREQRQAAVDFASPGAPFPWRWTQRAHDGLLVVEGAIATLHCTVARLTPAGDHDLVLGAVHGITHRGGEPLLVHRGRFGGLVTDATVPAGHPIALTEGAGW
jgi:3-hydroxy-9,10-secoandrosta-1,3,5(10)-triene-9,17-dione monooxygenase reductase component